jgi:hypothetical protein
VGVSHFALDFSLRDQSGNAIDDNDIYGAAPDQGFCYFQRLFSGVGLRDVKVLCFHPAVSRIRAV